MFDITRDSDGTLVLAGRLDAAAADRAREALRNVDGTCLLDCTGLDYIASAGLGLLAATQRRLLDQGGELVLAGLNPHLREVFRLSGFESVFRLE